MFEKKTTTDLLLLLNINDSDTFLNKLNPGMTRHRLKNLIAANIAKHKVRIGSILNKGVFIGSVPIEIVWMLVSLNMITSLPLLVALGFFAIMSTGILAWYAVTISSDDRISGEEKILKEKLCMQLKNEMLVELNNRITKKLEQECKHSPVVSKWNIHTTKLDRETKNELLIRLNKEPVLIEEFHNNTTPEKTSSYVLPLLACAVASTLLVSFFWGSSEIIAALGFIALSSALVSPVGLAIAACVSISVGIYLGYQRYQYQQHIAALKNEVKQLSNLKDRRLTEYHLDSNLFKKLVKARILANEPKDIGEKSIESKIPAANCVHNVSLSHVSTKSVTTLENAFSPTPR